MINFASGLDEVFSVFLFWDFGGKVDGLRRKYQRPFCRSVEKKHCDPRDALDWNKKVIFTVLLLI